MSAIIIQDNKYPFISDCKKINGKWTKIVSWTNNTQEATIFSTEGRAKNFMTENNIACGTILSVSTPPIHWYHVSEETGENMGIDGKDYVYFITGNIGTVLEDGEWVSTDEGFIELQDFIFLAENHDLLEIAKKNGAFLDDDEWFFSSKKKANKFASLLKEELKKSGIRLVEDF